jgi:hypothetical protein
MISQQSQKLIDKKWPGVKDSKVLLQNARQELLNFAYMFTVPPDANDKFLARALRKTKSIRFFAVGMMIFAVLRFIDEKTNVVTISAYGGMFEGLVVAFIGYWFYKDRMRLITCYNELVSESKSEIANPNS